MRAAVDARHPPQKTSVPGWDRVDTARPGEHNNTTRAHTIRANRLFNSRSVSLHVQPVWNPVKLQGRVDGERKKRETAHEDKLPRLSHEDESTHQG